MEAASWTLTRGWMCFIRQVSVYERGKESRSVRGRFCFLYLAFVEWRAIYDIGLESGGDEYPQRNDGHVPAFGKKGDAEVPVVVLRRLLEVDEWVKKRDVKGFILGGPCRSGGLVRFPSSVGGIRRRRTSG